MKIDDDHLYHGAALLQIAEHPQFTAINRLTTTQGTARSSFRVNDNIGIYLKYASVPKGKFKEYVFNFSKSHLAEIAEISHMVSGGTFIPLVCVKDREICCLTAQQLDDLVGYRKEARGQDEGTYTVLAALEKGRAFRVYVSHPGTKKMFAGKKLVIPRKTFPEILFE